MPGSAEYTEGHPKEDKGSTVTSSPLSVPPSGGPASQPWRVDYNWWMAQTFIFTSTEPTLDTGLLSCP